MTRAPKQPPRPKPGSRWRILAHAKPGAFLKVLLSAGSLDVRDYGVFDELVIDDWFHLEQMGARSWWMHVGDASINVRIGRDGKARLRIERGEYGPVVGEEKGRRR